MTSKNLVKKSYLAIALSGCLSSMAYAIDAPLDTSGSEVAQSYANDGVITWTWSAVSGASSYQVTVDGAYVGETSDLSFTSSDLWAGEHSMTVEAIDASGNSSVQSATANVDVTTGIGSKSIDSSVQGDASASSVESLIDPASYDYPEVYEHSGYELVFSDEFNGTALNPYRWNSQLRWDGEFNGERFEYRVINGEDQFYVNVLSEDQEHLDTIAPVYDPFQFSGSTLSIRSAKNSLQTNTNELTYGSLEQISSQQTFLSGVISTHDKFSQKYGYFEASIKIPSATGTFPAFWLLHDKEANEGTQRTEIDIMENLGHAPWYIYNSFHYFKNVTSSYFGDATFMKPEPSGQVYDGTDFSEEFHVYAVKWTESNIVWYIDGVQVSEVSSNEANYEELYVIINLAMGGNWTNFPTTAGGLGRSSDALFPNANDLVEFDNPALEIDYVRFYKAQ
ncbi:glycoside hydrolase family 16 protein [Granulosicoccus antarcticus]|uniref:Glucan endo-1,3-beta-glucosidase A1 n=1 Tax=Granulosicoccus antarcticus IMCC3135 TaxID=1192854 RepID=A0A2Z2NMX3_9GAMM|nr:glycoside hydrolase family 16 protein [Granulosicoccus antarcticus]ASJ72736.1 Glucan endo-1,3-beta-glucosidase A1 [Granulosicoccus antarcticus IMCC3135]